MPLLVLGLVCGWGFFRVAKVPPPVNKLSVALVQPSIPQQLIWQSGTGNERLSKVLELSRLALATKPDLLVWPEACAPISAERWPEVFDMVKSSSVTLLFGVDDAERDADEVRYFNSAVFPDAGRPAVAELPQAAAGHVWRVYSVRKSTAIHEIFVTDRW